MEHAQPAPTPFPWRAATVLVAGVALVELVALIAIGLTHFAPGSGTPAARTQVDRVATAPATTPTTHVVKKAKPVAQLPLRPISKVHVLVLNGNGVTGAAGTEAAHLQAAGYRVAGAADAQRHDYPASMVFFVPGWQKEARRLARSAGIRVVAPMDGLRGSQLKGSTVVLLLGK